ncbi:MAG: diaminopimelate epimerase [Pseudomonadota bacterium]
MRLRFTKMHGQGNDFVMLNGVSQPHARTLTATQIRAISDRHFGIGCDQVLLAETSSKTDVDFRYRIFNASGEEVEHCGNGARCFPLFVRDEGLTTKSTLRVETMNGVICPRIEADGSVTVDMGAPRFSPGDIPYIADNKALRYNIDVGGNQREIGVVSMGNPHAVQRVDDVDIAPVTSEGPLIEHHASFPNRVNVGYMQLVSRSHIRLRVWERGAGETLACGTGACAAVVTGIGWGLLDTTVTVTTRGGELSVTWQGGDSLVYMVGTAVLVFRGEIEI